MTRIDASLARALGAETDLPLTPVALLAELYGDQTGPERWRQVEARARALAAAQCTDDEVAAALGAELDLSPGLADALVEALADDLARASEAARALLRERMWDIATGTSAASKDAQAAATTAARQYLAWEGGPDAKRLGAAIREAEAGGGRGRGRG